MFNRILTGIFGSRNERLLRQMNKVVAKINAFEPALQALTDEELRAKTDEFKQRLGAGATLDDLAWMENIYSPPIGALFEPVAIAAQNGLAALREKAAA